jgi:hypothetical protein
LFRFCTEAWIEPMDALMDNDPEILAQTGATKSYCVRSIVPLDDGSIVASDWMCAEVVIVS